MTSRTSRSFWKRFDALPHEVHAQARAAYALFTQHPFHQSLQFKKVVDHPPTWSVRVGLHLCALAVQDDDVFIWFWIGSHAEYDNRLSRL